MNGSELICLKYMAKRILSVVICFAVLMSVGAGSCFALREEFADTSSFLVKICVYIEFYYSDGSYGGYATSRGTGLLVGRDGEMQGVVTNASVVGGEHLASFAESLVSEYGFAGYNIGVPQVIPEGNDNIWGISGKILLTNESCDLAVLQLSSPIYVDDDLEVRRSLSLVEGEQVFSVCFAEVSDNNYELSISEGYVSEIAAVEEDRYNYTFVSHDAPISDTAQGGFLLDCDGAVIGLLTDKAPASPFGGLCAYSVADIMTYYLYGFGWDDCELTHMPDESIIIDPSDNHYPADPGNSVSQGSAFENYVYKLLEKFGFSLHLDFEDDLPDFFGNVLRVLLFVLLIFIVLVLFVVGFFGFVVLVAGASVVICLVIKKKRRAKSDDVTVSVSEETDSNA